MKSSKLKSVPGEPVVPGRQTALKLQTTAQMESPPFSMHSKPSAVAVAVREALTVWMALAVAVREFAQFLRQRVSAVLGPPVKETLVPAAHGLMVLAVAVAQAAQAQLPSQLPADLVVWAFHPKSRVSL
jgi:hypothetical protein